MKLYPKKLNNLEDLKREKQRLKEELKSIEDKGLISKDDFFGEIGGGDIIGTATGLLKGGSIKDAALAVGMPLLKLAGSTLEAATIKKIAKNVVGGYAKWQAIQLAYKLVSRAVAHYKKKAKEKKQAV